MHAMIERVLLVAWKGSAATAWVDTLRSGGFQVLLEDTTGERAWRTAKERGIDLVIIDGQKKPSHGRATGHTLRDTAKTRDIPIVWTNLDVEDTAAIHAEVHPDMLLPAPTDAGMALAAVCSLQASAAAAAAAAPAASAGDDPEAPAHGDDADSPGHAKPAEALPKRSRRARAGAGSTARVATRGTVRKDAHSRAAQRKAPPADRPRPSRSGRPASRGTARRTK